MARRTGFYQHGREHGCAANERVNTAINEFRWQQYRRQLHYAGRAHACGLGEQAVDEGINDMKPGTMVTENASVIRIYAVLT